MRKSTVARQQHIVVVDAYQGYLEHLTDEVGEQTAASGLGLPLAEMCGAMDCRMSLLDWSLWHRFEEREDAFARWMPFPATRPVDRFLAPAVEPFAGVDAIRRRSIPAEDPDFGSPFEHGLSPRTYGLLAESDPLFLASYVLNACLEDLHRVDPIDAVILPMFGGCGYVAQMSRATGAGLSDVPFAVVVTGSSADRQYANGEGHWTRPAITRRQMEDLSLGLADLAIYFGPCGRGRAERGRSQGAAVQAPRRVDTAQLDEIERAGNQEARGPGPQFFLHEPKAGASGVLLMLDGARHLYASGDHLQAPISCSGRNMRFPPSLPRDFEGYWSGRGWAKQLVDDGLWRWDEGPPATGRQAVRVYPSLFEHLPDIWSELAKGGAVLLSPEAAEGLAPGVELPALSVMDQTPDPARLAEHLRQLAEAGPAAVDGARRALCEAVVSAHRGQGRQELLKGAISALTDMLDGRLERPSLDRAAQRLLDARLDRTDADRPLAVRERHGRDKSLCVAVSCYEMGGLVVETVESIWRADRLPDELLLIDDGSKGAETLEAIAQLERAASTRRLPLTVVRQVNQGLASARNTALDATSCGYISFLDGDDLIDPRFYSLALQILEDNPGLGGVAAWAETFGVGIAPGFWNAPQAEMPLLLAENTVFVPCMSPVALLRELGGYDTRQRYNYEDWELSIRLLAAGWPIVTIPRYLQRYRVRPDSLLRTMSDVQNQVMREALFRHHRATVEKFGPELAAQIEHKLMRMAARQAQSETVTTKGPRALLGQARARFLHMMASFRSRTRAFVSTGTDRR